MARRITRIIFALLVLAGCANSAQAAQKSATTKEKSLWQIIADSFKDFKIREQDKVKGIKNVTVFQNLSDSIKKGSKSAKGQSLRGK